MFTTEDILAMLRAGEDAKDLASSFVKSLNDAVSALTKDAERTIAADKLITEIQNFLKKYYAGKSIPKMFDNGEAFTKWLDEKMAQKSSSKVEKKDSPFEAFFKQQGL